MIDPDLLSPVDLVHDIQNLKSDFDDDYIITSIVRVAEESARKVLTSKGYHPHLEVYGYVDDPELSPAENRRERLMSDRSDWINEAIHLNEHPDPEVMAAAFTIIEAARLRGYVEFGQMEKAIISMANMIACGLVHLNQRKDELTALMRNKFEEIKPDVLLGKSTRQNLKSFATKLGKQQTQAREPKWQEWRLCAEQIRADKPSIKSNSEIARIVKKRLKLPDSIETIRKRIKRI